MLQSFRSVLDARLDGPADRPLAVALSGGGDSLALLSLLKPWADRSGRALIAFTVDHGLNPDSPAWTQFAGRAAANLGVAWRDLAWTGPKPLSGIAAAARLARHRLLADAAREAGGSVVLMGHTADDVLESEVLRRTTPGLGRLRTWSASPVWPQGRDVFLLRPLLHARRDALRDHLTRLGRDWLDDPANLDPRSARALARIQLAAGPDGRGEISDSQAPHPPSGLLAGVATSADGRLSAPRACFRDLDRPLACRMIAMLALCAAGTSRPPRRDRLDGLLDQLTSSGAFTASLAGARVTATLAQVEFSREAGERARGGLTPVFLQGDRVVVFDGRFEAVASAEVPPAVSLGPLAGRIAQLSPADAAAVRRIPAFARAALPVVIAPGHAPALPSPLGTAPIRVRQLASRRFAAACGLVARESDIAYGEGLMAPQACSPYVDGGNLR